MRVVVAAVGRLVPELALLAGELSRRFDTLVLLGSRSRSDASMMSCVRPHPPHFDHWTTTQSNAKLQRQLTGADVIVHLPPRVDEAPVENGSLRQRSIATIADAVRRLKHRRPRRIVSLISAHELGSGREDGGALSLLADVTLLTARVGLLLRPPESTLQRTLWALRAQVAVKGGASAGIVQWIHQLDAARAISHLLENDSLTGQLNLMAPCPIALETFAHSVWRAYGLPSALRGAATASVARLLEAPLLRGPAATPRRLLDSGFGYLFPQLDSALADLMARPSP